MKSKYKMIIVVMLALICLLFYKEDKAFATNEEVITRDGTDVSGYTGIIDWSKVKARGIQFAMIRCGYRGPNDADLSKDSFFESNMKGALNAGIDVGIYYATQAVTKQEAIEEADVAVNMVKNILAQNGAYNLTLPIVIDLESNPNYRMNLANLSPAERTEIVIAFCKEIEAKGFTAMYYTNKDYLETKLIASKITSQYPLWYAHYTNDKSQLSNSTATIFQYSKSGSIEGIQGKADLDVQYMKMPDQVRNLKSTIKSETQIFLSWSRIPGVYGYKIYRKSSVDNREVLLATVKGAGTCTYNDITLKHGVTYTYRVCGFLKTKLKDYNGIISSSVTNQLTVRFNSQGGSSVGSKVALYKTIITKPKDPTKSGYTFINWYKESTLKTKWDFIKDKATNNITLYAKWAKNPSAPTTIKVVKASKTSTKVTWSSVKGTTKYEIYRASSKTGTYKLLATISNTSYKNTGLTKGKTYYYKVKEYKVVDGKKVYSGYTKIVSIKI